MMYKYLVVCVLASISSTGFSISVSTPDDDTLETALQHAGLSDFARKSFLINHLAGRTLELNVVIERMELAIYNYTNSFREVTPVSLHNTNLVERNREVILGILLQNNLEAIRELDRTQIYGPIDHNDEF